MKYHLDQIHVLLAEPDRNSRHYIRDILLNAGFRNLMITSSYEQVEQGFEVNSPELIISSPDLPGGDVCELMYRVRHHEIGRNPFLVAIMLIAAPTRELVKRVIDSGCDDLIGKPMTLKALMDRITAIIISRRMFVVTTDYLGPDRHKGSFREARFPRVEVPNILAAKAKGEPLPSQAAIDATIAEINQRKMEVHAQQIGLLIDEVVPLLQAGTVDDRVRAQTKQLIILAEDINCRLVGTKFAHVQELCGSLMTVTRAIHGNLGAPAVRDIQLLKPLSQAIYTALVATGDFASTIQRISETVSTRQFFIDESDEERPVAKREAASQEAISEEAEPVAQGAKSETPPLTGEETGKDQRHLYLLRLHIAKVSHLFYTGGGTRNYVPRQFILGFDDFLRMLMGNHLYSELNAEAKSLLSCLKSDEDFEIWQELLEKEQHRRFVFTILVRVLMKFTNFERARRNFITIINQGGPEKVMNLFNEVHFNIFFATLFKEIFETLNDPDQVSMFDLHFGEGTSKKVRAIHETFKQSFLGVVGDAKEG